jgi:HK97 family phage prohead protease
MRSAGQFGVKRPIALATSCRLTLVRLQAGSTGPAGSLRIVGCAVPYGKLSCDLGGFREVYEPACFSESLADDLRVLFNHNVNYLVGRKSAGTAIFYDTIDGLQVEAEPPETSWANDLIVSMDRADIDQMSAAFYITKSRTEYQGSEKIRVVEKGRLLEASVTSFAAYDATSAAVKKDQSQQLAAGANYLNPRTEKGAPIQ